MSLQPCDLLDSMDNNEVSCLEVVVILKYMD